MRSTWPVVELGRVLTHRKEFIEIDDLTTYARPRVRLHAQGIVQRDRVLGAEIKTKKQQVCRPGEFLVAEIDAKVGGFGIVPDELDGALVSSHYFLFQIDSSKLDRRFLDFYSRTRGFREQVEAQGSTNYAAIRPADVLAYEVPLPPLPEQRRIVERIEAITGKVEEARRLREEADAAAKAFVFARISALYPNDSCWVRVSDAVAKARNAVRSGPFGSQLRHEEFADAGVAAIGTRDVQTNRFELKSGWYVPVEKFAALQRYRVFPGDVLCTIVGASIGRFCVVPKDVPLAFTTKHIQALTLDPAVAMSEFAVLMLNFHRRCRDSMFSQVEGSAQPSLNAGKILAIALPLPPLNEQDRVVTEFRELKVMLDAAAECAGASSASLDALLPSILSAAFSGER